MRNIGVVLVALAAVGFAGETRAASKRQCVAACAEQIAACQMTCVPFGGGATEPGGRKLGRACRAGVLKRCRRDGVETCEVGGAPAGTTTTTVPVTTTTVPRTSTTTTSVPTSTTATTTSSTTTTQPPSGLAGLIGRWRFEFTILSTFTADYDFTNIEIVGGIPTLVGQDEFGDLVIVSRTADLGGGVPFEFAMLDPGVILCDFYLFDRTGPNTIAGEHWLTDIDFDGSCGDLIGGPHPLTGARLAAVLGSRRRAATVAERAAAEAVRADEAGPGIEPGDEATGRVLGAIENLLR